MPGNNWRKHYRRSQAGATLPADPFSDPDGDHDDGISEEETEIEIRRCTFGSCRAVLSISNPTNQCFRHPVPINESDRRLDMKTVAMPVLKWRKSTNSEYYDELVSFIAASCNVTIADILNRSSARQVTTARQLVIYFMLEKLGLDDDEVIKLLGPQPSSGLNYACRRAKHLLLVRKEISLIIHQAYEKFKKFKNPKT